MNPINARAGQNRRSGHQARRRAVRMATSSSEPSAARVKMRVTGEICATTARVATNETPQKTMASSTPRRGGKRQPPVETGILSGNHLRALRAVERTATFEEGGRHNEGGTRDHPRHPR